MARSEAVSHWHHAVESFNTSAMEFFNSIEATLAEKEAPVAKTRVTLSESGILSPRREYLRLSHGRFHFDISAGAFGKDFFFSWWLARRKPDGALLIGCVGLLALPVVLLIAVKVGGLIMGTIFFLILLAAAGFFLLQGPNAADVEDAILAVPVVGSLYETFIRPTTYYSEDSRKMFEETVHRVVVSHVSALLTASKLPPLSPEKSKILSGVSAS